MKRLILNPSRRQSLGRKHHGLTREATRPQPQKASRCIVAVVGRETAPSLRASKDPVRVSQHRSEQQCVTWSGGLSVWTASTRREGQND